MKNILIVEDSATYRELLCKVLKGKGYKVKGVGSVKSSLNEIKKDIYDFICTDYNFPDDTGTALLQHEFTKNIPICIMTTSVDRHIFNMAKSGRSLMPSAINNILYNIVDAYNKKEAQIAKTEHRNAELLPKVSAHIMRHTACTRMVEKRIDVKVLQYIMGHAHIDITMDVYNHVSEMSRIESEITRLDSVAIS